MFNRALDARNGQPAKLEEVIWLSKILPFSIPKYTGLRESESYRDNY